LLRNSDTLRTALAVCEQASPANAGGNFNKEVFSQAHVAHIQLGMDRGYNLFPQIFRGLAVSMSQETAIEPTYEKPLEQEEAANA